MAKIARLEMMRDFRKALWTANFSPEVHTLTDTEKSKLKQQVAAFYDYHASSARPDTWNWGLIDRETHDYIRAKIPTYDQFGRDGFSEQLYAYVLRHVPSKNRPNVRILEVGCGTGIGLNFLSRLEAEASFVGLDISAPAIEVANASLSRAGRLQYVHGDAERLPFADQEFDAVINVESAHNYPDFPRFMSEVVRVLKPGGYFSIADLYTNERMAFMKQLSERSQLTQLATDNVTERVKAAILTRMQPGSVLRTKSRKAGQFPFGFLNERVQMFAHGAGFAGYKDDFLIRLMSGSDKKAAPKEERIDFAGYFSYLLEKRG